MFKRESSARHVSHVHISQHAFLHTTSKGPMIRKIQEPLTPRDINPSML